MYTGARQGEAGYGNEKDLHKGKYGQGSVDQNEVDMKQTRK